MQREFKLSLVLFIILIHSQISSEQSKGSRIEVNSSEDEDESDRLERERTRNVVRLAATDQLNSEIITNRTRAYLSCESGEMIVKINFSTPFRGVAYANYDRSSHCKFYGDGSRYYEMIIPLKGCGTKQEAPRLFINNIVFRFHRSLELEEDEIKTIICRYPPPLAPPPSDPIPPILEPAPPVPIMIPAKISEIELLLIICALLFLTLLLLGIGCAYYCLKRRNIKIIRKKKALSTGPPSEITKLSHPSTIFNEIRIPRAIAHSTESSETIPSDYPSESLSDDDGRRTIVSETSTIRNDHFKYENTAYVAEPYPVDGEREGSVYNLPVPALQLPKITTQDYFTTLLETQNTIDTSIIDTIHRRKKTQLLKQLENKRTASIPDNDDRSELEVIENVEQITKPSRIDISELDDTFIDRDYHADIDETVVQNKLVPYVPPSKITVKEIDDVFVTNISETTIVEQQQKKIDFNKKKLDLLSHLSYNNNSNKMLLMKEIDERNIDQFKLTDETTTTTKRNLYSSEPKQKTTRTITETDDIYDVYETDVREFQSDTRLVNRGNNLSQLPDDRTITPRSTLAALPSTPSTSQSATMGATETTTAFAVASTSSATYKADRSDENMMYQRFYAQQTHSNNRNDFKRDSHLIDRDTTDYSYQLPQITKYSKEIASTSSNFDNRLERSSNRQHYQAQPTTEIYDVYETDVREFKSDTRLINRAQSVDEREEINSITETDIYDHRYP